MNNEDIIIYQTPDGISQLEVQLKDETVWVNRQQMSVVFDRDVKTIGKHINNALKEELADISVVANFATTATDGKTYQVDYYKYKNIGQLKKIKEEMINFAAHIRQKTRLHHRHLIFERGSSRDCGAKVVKIF